jgi:hypothetical protein
MRLYPQLGLGIVIMANTHPRLRPPPTVSAYVTAFTR